jgi:phosphoenolpyruvate carboxylase
MRVNGVDVTMPDGQAEALIRLGRMVPRVCGRCGVFAWARHARLASLPRPLRRSGAGHPAGWPAFLSGFQAPPGSQER